MGKCKVCGKKGFFLYVNNEGRCNSCEKEYQHEKNQERILLEQKKLEEENQKKNDAKEQLKKILDFLILLDTPLCYLEDCEQLLLIIDKRIEQCQEYRDIIRANEKNPYFFEQVREYAYAGNMTSLHQISGVQCGIQNRIRLFAADPVLMVMFYLNHFSYEFEEAWKEEKKEIKKIMWTNYNEAVSKTISESIIPIEPDMKGANNDKTSSLYEKNKVILSALSGI